MLNLSTIYLVRPYLTQMFLDDGMTVQLSRSVLSAGGECDQWQHYCGVSAATTSAYRFSAEWENIGAVISRGQQGHVLGLGYKGSLGSRYKVWRQAKENWQHFSSSIGSCFSDPFGSFAQDSRTAFELSMLLDKQLNSPYSALRRGPLGTGMASLRGQNNAQH